MTEEKMIIDDAMGLLEKLGTLLKSRRLWLLVAQAVIVLVAIAALVAPVVGAEIDTSDLPAQEALADRLMNGVEGIAVIIGSILAVLRVVSGAQDLSADYTMRPAGVKDRVGVAE